MTPVLGAAFAGACLLLPAPIAAGVQDDPGPAAAATADPVPGDSPTEEFVVLTEEEEQLAGFETAMKDAFGLLGELFRVDPLTAAQEARLPLAETMASIVMPEGSFGVAMHQSIEPMMTIILAEATGDPRSRLAEISGVGTAELEALSDESAQEALDIFDPHHAARNQQMMGLTTRMIGELLAAIEPSYRAAMAHSFAVRFEDAEMRELLGFLATPTGGKFARESFLVQYDPRMIGAMEAMGPAFVEIMPAMIDEIAALEAELGSSRRFGELSKPERERAARLIGKSVRELDMLAPEPEPETGDESAEGDRVI